jgi:GH24 family phage-related lysozyme (muramidase)
MPINKIVSTKRGKAAIAGAIIAAVASGWTTYTSSRAVVPATVQSAIAQGMTPPAVALAVEKLIKPWEGLKLVAYKDIVGVWTICYGETEGVKPGMRMTALECEAMLIKRVTKDYYLPLVNGVSGFAKAPVSVQASLTSGAYNFGVSAAKKSTAARWISAGNYRAACEAQTAFNKAGGKVVKGLVLRREMGDANRLGEAELCVSGL